jgi:hypothetical protein
MVTKFFAVANVTALGGLVAVLGGGCASPDDASDKTSLPPNASKVSPTDSAGGGSRSGAPSCKAKVNFVPPETKPPAPKSITACSPTILNTLADACTDDPNAKACSDVRASAGNKTCADCIFGTKSDLQWKVVNLAPGQKPPVTYNQEGCIENITGVKGCGHSYMTNLACLLDHCNSCRDATSGKSCLSEVATNECKPHKVDEDCLKAVDKNQEQLAGCFPDAQDRKSVKDFFVHIAGAACGGAKSSG